MAVFSILIPTRNRAEYLKYALDSALSQTYKDFEVVISDNNSDDNTRQVVEAAKDSRIKYVQTGKFINVGDNFNNVFNNSSGEYFILMGDDDLLMPYYLEVIYRCLESNPSAEVFLSNTAQFDYRTNKLQFYSGERIDFKEVDKTQIIRKYFDFVADPHNPTMGCFARRLAERIMLNGRLYGGTFPDYLANFSMVIKAKQVFKTDLLTNITTITKKSLCIKQFSSSINARQEIFDQSPMLKSIPTPIEGSFIHANGYYQTLVLLQQRFPEEVGRFEINKKVYYESVGRELVALSFGDFKGLDVKQLYQLQIFCKKAPFLILISSLFFHFPSRMLYGIVPERIKDVMSNFLNKMIGRRTINLTQYLGKDFHDIASLKDRVMAYQRTLVSKI